ncbi:DMT family transporter [[Clostridium] hylemonae]|uniref:Membrane protein n=1 Tax=[Clostridium] hylemonae DSM 15053 TaxID=553973 RepID=C0C4L5_9FIRM|nr:DMT family transporter [[Clostridium] hylemonae]EEG73008.1 putative membrane protein [[Clostridium] hylemonae DSM 15053]QEK16247.1 putative cystine transporter YijE [[Clostridium] hylemonae DSM 15053]BDF03691.1 permease [[Clostridium] hylemonae]
MERTLQKPAVRGLLALLCCALWGSAFPCVKTGYEWLHIETTGSQILFAGYRFFLAGVLTFIMGSVMERRILRMKKSSVPYVLRQGLMQTTLQYVFFYIGMANTTGTKGSVINASNAFISILAAPLLIKGEKLTWKQGVGCAVGFLGVIIINLEPGAWGDGFSFGGEGMVLICTVFYGISTVIMKKISHLESAMTITAYQLLFGGFILTVIGFAAGGRIAGFDGKSAALLIYMAMLSAVAFSLWTILLKYNSVGKVAIFGFSIPVFGVFLSAVILGEQIISLKNFAALICVSIGILLVNGLAVQCGRKKEQVS